MPARPDYFGFLHALKKDVSTSFGDIGVVALEYCESRQSLESTAPQTFLTNSTFSAGPQLSFTDPIEAGQFGAIASSQ